MADFLFVIVELFSLALTVEMLSADIGRSRRFSKGWVTLSANFRWTETSATNLFWFQKNKLITLSCGVKSSAVCSFISSQSTRLTDGQTDGRTDGQNYDPKTALA